MGLLAVLEILGGDGFVARRDPAALGGLTVLGHLQYLGVHLVHHQHALEALIHAWVGAIPVLHQIAMADGLDAPILPKGEAIIAVVPVGPQLHIFLVAECGVVVGILAHEIAAGLCCLQPFNAPEGLL